MNIYNCLFFDIETTTEYKDIYEFERLDPIGFKVFKTKQKKRSEHDKSWDLPLEELYPLKGALVHEYNKIICISMAYYNNDDWVYSSFTGDEPDIINKFNKVATNANNNNFSLGGYNITGFDIPLLNKKYFKYGIKLPYLLRVEGKKPWEMNLIELSDIWKCGGRDYSTLEEVCYVLDVESPKQVISGADVYEYYHHRNDIDTIIDYCENDVRASIEVAIKLGESLN